VCSSESWYTVAFEASRWSWCRTVDTVSVVLTSWWRHSRSIFHELTCIQHFVSHINSVKQRLCWKLQHNDDDDDDDDDDDVNNGCWQLTRSTGRHGPYSCWYNYKQPGRAGSSVSVWLVCLMWLWKLPGVKIFAGIFPT